MRATSLLLTALSSQLLASPVQRKASSSSGLVEFLGSQSADDTDTLTDCSLTQDFLNITSLSVFPDPPQRGQDATITIVGNLKEDIQDGSKLKLLVKMGPIALTRQEVDICQELNQSGDACPIKQGDVVFSKSFRIPAEVPNGKYYAKLDLYVPGNIVPAACVQAHVSF
ncbi:Phosphatidylglycerol/phosphatidylinositol transfer protein [Chytriomyces hyalinus]|nr:Phosphatidylglycerol/phosphatidylinositol transfer protein [Chytriomyces hyalinus]